MHCYCCDRHLEQPVYDKLTDRYYCSTCLEPTIDEQLSLMEAGLEVRVGGWETWIEKSEPVDVAAEIDLVLREEDNEEEAPF